MEDWKEALEAIQQERKEAIEALKQERAEIQGRLLELLDVLDGPFYGEHRLKAALTHILKERDKLSDEERDVLDGKAEFESLILRHTAIEAQIERALIAGADEIYARYLKDVHREH